MGFISRAGSSPVSGTLNTEFTSATRGNLHSFIIRQVEKDEADNKAPQVAYLFMGAVAACFGARRSELSEAAGRVACSNSLKQLNLAV